MAALVPQAVPVPRNQVIAALHASTTDDGLEFDLELAQNTPRTPGHPAPGVNAATVAYVAPALPAAGALPMCNDRAAHLNIPASGACASFPGNQIVPLWPTAKFMGPPPMGVNPQVFECLYSAMASGIFHGRGHMVCSRCLEDSRAQPWSVDIRLNVTTRPVLAPNQNQCLTQNALAAVPAGNPAVLYKNFLTYMCNTCENEEIRLLLERTAPGAQVDPGLEQRMNHGPLVTDYWPFVTCICLEKWHEHCDAISDACIRHRHGVACDDHDRLLIIRAQNDKWLREVGHHPTHQNRLVRLVQGVPQFREKLNTRRRTGYHRACRCGSEPRHHQPRVYLCMGCEGVVHLTPNARDANGYLIPPVDFNRRVTRAGTRALDGDFRLRRALDM